MDIGNRCVCCGEDTSFGSGNFVNRIPADADYESYDKQGHLVFSDGEYRDGYLCPDCSAIECDRCDEMISIDEDICPYDVYDEDDPRGQEEFSDGSWRVHFECLTKEEKQHLKESA